MSKNIRKAIISRASLLNKFRKENTFFNHLGYNFYVEVLAEIKKNFYDNLIVNIITDNMSFWKKIKPVFTENTLKDEKIVLVECA